MARGGVGGGGVFHFSEIGTRRLIGISKIVAIMKDLSACHIENRSNCMEKGGVAKRYCLFAAGVD